MIDSGDGVTHVIPVAEGYVIGKNQSCLRNIWPVFLLKPTT